MLEAAHGLTLPVDSLKLSNGLKVKLHHDDTVPIVAVHVCYHAGSKDESPNLTGLAHLFEHLMFEGSAGWDDDYFKPLQEAGGSVNGSTSRDYTSYYDVVPSNFLDLALWLEADRMANLLPALSPAKLENQRSVVKNERHQRVDNQPYGRVSEESYALLYPADHPYHWPIIGWEDHLDAISMGDVTNFFQRHYCPENAVLVLSGAFDRDQALRSIEHSFGAIAGGRPNDRLAQRPGRVVGEVRRAMEEKVGLARLDLLWPTVPRFHRDEPALDFAAQILAGGRESRLRKSLQRDRSLAHSVDASHSTMALAGQFGMSVFALADRNLDDIEPVALAGVAGLAASPPTADEMQRALNAFLNRAFSRLETSLSKAALIQHFAFHASDFNATSFGEEIAAYRAVRVEDVVRVVGQYLGPSRIVVSVRVGDPQSKKLGNERSPAQPKERMGGDAQRLPRPGRTPHFAMPQIEATRVGELDLVAIRTPAKPRVLLELVADAGSSVEHPDHLGRAKLMSYCLDEGTESLEGPALASRIELLGAAVGVSSGIECTTVTLRSLRSTLRESLDLFADVVKRPAFRGADVEREAQRLIAELVHKANQPRAIADEAIDELIFGASHPYGRTSDGTTASIQSQSPTDLVEFHRSFVTAQRSALVVVGDVSLDETVRLVSNSLGTWGDQTQRFASHAVYETEAACEKLKVVERIEATQSVIRIGLTAPPRDTPDYEALVLLNTILGGQFSSRLNAKLREEMGATYGVQSSFVLRRHGGSFLAGSDVDAGRTRESLAAMIGEILAIAEGRPITAKELEYAKAYLTRRFPARFETQSGVLSHVTHTIVYRLPLDYYSGYLERVASVTLDQIQQCAARRLSREAMKVVVVGRPDSLVGVDEIVDDRVGL